MSVDNDLVTGEAVVLELQPASFVIRALALALDLFAAALSVALLAWLLVSTTDVLGSAGGNAVALVAVIGVLVGIPVTVETLTRGRSLGKAAAGLRVVRDDGGPIRVRHALIRALLGVLELYWSFGSVALITSLLNRRGKRLGDLLAGTYVIRERAPAEGPDPIQMPPSLQAWATSADIGRIPDRLVLAVRRFLTRQDRLVPAEQQRLALALAGQLSTHVWPPPPPGTGPGDFLSAVLAERRDRDYRRLQRQAAAAAARRRLHTAAGPLSAVGTGLIEGPEQ